MSTDPLDAARDYYNSDDAEAFYSAIWGGEDIHIGMYESRTDDIARASRRTVEHMAEYLTGISASSSVLDIGSGYGGAARYLARTFGCRITALNLSDVENERARRLNTEQGLSERIDIVDGSFEAIPGPDKSFDFIWSQDAILHSGDRARVIAEVSRALRPSGRFVFTDPMQADDCPTGVLQPILDRIHLSSLATPEFYRQAARENGLVEEGFEDLTGMMVMHYTRVLEETEKRTEELRAAISAAYIERMKAGLQHWIDGGENKHLVWGIFRFRQAS